MTTKVKTLMLTACLLLGTSGCAAITTGEASWEVFAGCRTKQHSEEGAEVRIESSVVEKIVDSMTDKEITEAE